MNRTPSRSTGRSAYLLLEALAYLAVITVVLGVGYAALYRVIDNSVVLHRTADDVALALETGERWRADVRAAGHGLRTENTEAGQVLHLFGPAGTVDYRFGNGLLYRRAGTGPWVGLLRDVKASSMEEDRRPNVTAWRWELELQPRAKGRLKASRIRPLFTFLAVPVTGSNP